MKNKEISVGDTVVLNAKYEGVYQPRGAIGKVEDVCFYRVIVKFQDCYQNCKEYMLDYKGEEENGN